MIPLRYVRGLELLVLILVVVLSASNSTFQWEPSHSAHVKRLSHELEWCKVRNIIKMIREFYFKSLEVNSTLYSVHI